MPRKPNIATVAEHAGVAVSTVSRYLNDRHVSPKARAEIAKVIEQLGYTRSSTARNLSLGRHGCIGVVVDSSQDPWFTRLLGGIETELSKRDSSLMLASTELTGKYDPGIVFEWIRERRVDGLIIAPTGGDHSYLRTDLPKNFPLVAINRAIERAHQTIRHLRWFEVVRTSGHITDGKVSAGGVGMEVEEGLAIGWRRVTD
jgi:LacI family transcriptional regulator